ncbi:MAG: sulfotransferase family protein, partial [Actinomycetota bacterium]
MTTASNARAERSRGKRRDAAGPLPNFFIIGAMRSGTTALSRYMGAHPDVYVAPEKEVHFFDRLHERGLDWYRSRFAAATTERAIGEATQTYMYLADATERMAAAVPDARLVAILRNPVDRAYSHYWMNRSLRVEPLGFREALAAYPDDPPPSGQMYPYIERGRYLAQLERVCAHYPRSALHVLLLEDLVREPDATFATLC